jgi:predicted PurR-regulated permease PerM
VRLEQIFFVAFFAVIALVAFVILRPFVTFIVLAGILTYVLFPVYGFFRQRVRRPEVAAAISILLTLLVMVLPFVFFITELAEQVGGAYDNLKLESIDRIAAYVERLSGYRPDLRSMLASGLEQIRASMVDLAPDILGSIGELLIGLFVMFFVMYYGFRDGERFVKRIRDLLPLEPSLKVSLFHQVRTITHAVLYGQVMTAVIQGVLGTLGFLAFGVPNGLFWGSLMIVTALLPILGTPVVWIPAAISLFLSGQTARGIGLLIYSGTLVMNIDNFLRPRLVAGRTQIHPVLILIGVLGGFRVFGIIGLLIGPLVLALLVAFVKFFETAYLPPKISLVIPPEAGKQELEGRGPISSAS